MIDLGGYCSVGDCSDDIHRESADRHVRSRRNSTRPTGSSDDRRRPYRRGSPRSDLFEALNLVASGKVKPILETYPLARANEARERLETGKVRYRAVLQHG